MILHFKWRISTKGKKSKRKKKKKRTRKKDRKIPVDHGGDGGADQVLVGLLEHLKGSKDLEFGVIYNNKEI